MEQLVSKTTSETTRDHQSDTPPLLTISNPRLHRLQHRCSSSPDERYIKTHPAQVSRHRRQREDAEEGESFRQKPGKIGLHGCAGGEGRP